LLAARALLAFRNGALLIVELIEALRMGPNLG